MTLDNSDFIRLCIAATFGTSHNDFSGFVQVLKLSPELVNFAGIWLLFMRIDNIGGAGQRINGLKRCSAFNMLIVSIEFSKCLLKEGNPEAAIGANMGKIRFEGVTIIFYKRKVIIDDYSVRHTE